MGLALRVSRGEWLGLAALLALAASIRIPGLRYGLPFPLLNADENRPGTWTLRDSEGHAYGGIRITRQGADVYYLAQYRGNPIGRFDRLGTAVETVHLAPRDAGSPRAA